MSIIPVSYLSDSELAALGNNLVPAVGKQRRRQRRIEAVNPLLANSQEQLGRLYAGQLDTGDWRQVLVSR
jgi:hypothetical protein